MTENKKELDRLNDIYLESSEVFASSVKRFIDNKTSENRNKMNAAKRNADKIESMIVPRMLELYDEIEGS